MQAAAAPPRASRAGCPLLLRLCTSDQALYRYAGMTAYLPYKTE